MLLTRRKAMLGLLVAPVIIRTPGLLMPIKPLAGPYETAWHHFTSDIDIFGIDMYAFSLSGTSFPIAVQWEYNFDAPLAAVV